MYIRSLIAFVVLFAGSLFSAEVPEKLPLGSEQALWEYTHSQTVGLEFNLKYFNGKAWSFVPGRVAYVDFDPQSESMEYKTREYLDWAKQGLTLDVGKRYVLAYFFTGKNWETYAYATKQFTADSVDSFPQEMYVPEEPVLNTVFKLRMDGVTSASVLDENGVVKYTSVYSGQGTVEDPLWVYPDKNNVVFYTRIVTSGEPGKFIAGFADGTTAEYDLATGVLIPEVPVLEPQVEDPVVVVVEPDPTSNPRLVLNYSQNRGVVTLTVESFREGIQIQRRRSIGGEAKWEFLTVPQSASAAGEQTRQVEFDLRNPETTEQYFRIVESDPTPVAD
ncbi:MAG: hypothetical protein K9N62_05935 [Verrucomicrobia bacterium]|nr:hypothetical protein [Verrucomicrobiota bacterium]